MTKKRILCPKDDFARKNLDNANLSGEDLSDADLSNASMRRSQLKGVKLQNAKLAESDLHRARLDHADVTGADLRNADLTEASLHSVDLERAATTEGARLAGAKGLGGDRARETDDQTESPHIAQAVEEMMALNRGIAEAARAVSTPSTRASQDTSMPTGEDRRAAVDRIAELRVRRNLLEERILSIIEESMSDQRRSTIDDRS